MNIDWKIILLFITAGLDFAMTMFLLIKNIKDRSHLTFGLLSLFAGLWSLGVGMFLLTSQAEVTTAWLKIYYIAAACLAPLFYYFAASFCYPVLPFRKSGIGAHIVALFLVSMMVTNDSFLVVRSSWELIALNPYLYVIYSIYFLVILFFGFRVLWSKYRTSSGFAKKQLGVVMLAILIAACFGVFFDLLLPFVSYRYIYYGPYFTAIMCLIIYTFIFIRPVRER